MEVIELRGDIRHDNEEAVKNFIENTLSSRKYMYCKEKKKTNNVEHFHAMVYTKKYVVDTIRRKWKNTFKLSAKKKQFKVAVVRDVIDYGAYIIKDGDYVTKNIKDSDIEKMIIHNDNIQDEMEHKTLKAKCINYLNKNFIGNEMKIKLVMNSDIMMEILKWFKMKGLNYPSQAWLKNVMVTYLMQREDPLCDELNIRKLYNIQDPFLKNE